MCFILVVLLPVDGGGPCTQLTTGQGDPLVFKCNCLQYMNLPEVPSNSEDLVIKKPKKERIAFTFSVTLMHSLRLF